MNTRRDFIKKMAAAGTVGSVASFAPIWAGMESPVLESNLLRIDADHQKARYEPLEEILITCREKGTAGIIDSKGRVYHSIPAESNLSMRLGGAPGNQVIFLKDKKERILDLLLVRLEASSHIKDSEGTFSEIYNMLHYTMNSSRYFQGYHTNYNGNYYYCFSSWFQDHMYACKGTKYWHPEQLTGVDLYADGQREDGMIHDNYKHPYDPRSMWLQRFRYGDFVTIPEDPRSDAIFVRVPVENMAEFTFLEAIYRSWKVSGDDTWMEDKLDHALKAVEYATTDPYRWSEKYRLLKRGYTIDIWDFQSDEDTRIAGGDTMKIHLDTGRFNIMFGDNVRFAASCDYLSEMLEYSGREAEADRVREIGNGIRRRINELSWNGEFYTHQIPIDPSIQRDFGVDTDKQVVLSNAYALGANITHEQCTSIINTYQRIRREMPRSSPGEWYTCYPPFEKGWSKKKWNYMNGGVTSIVAGELALGAFRHGYETYAVDILKRIYKLALRTDYKLEGCYKGAMPEEPERSFQPLSLDPYVNVAFGPGEGDAIVWTGEPGNDMAEFPTGLQRFENIPFRVSDPSANQNRGCLAISADQGYKLTETIPVNDKAASVYFLHTLPEGSVAGLVRLVYDDGSDHLQYIHKGQQIGNWWHPSPASERSAELHMKNAWYGKNKVSIEIAIQVYGMGNPHPGKTIRQIELEGMKKGSKWMIAAITLSDHPVFLMPGIVSTIPAHWGAAALVDAMYEGLAGAQNCSHGFREAVLAPRWPAAGVRKADVVAHYPASDGYLAYRSDQQNDRLNLTVTSSGESIRPEIMIPSGQSVTDVQIDGNRAESFETKSVESTSYLVLPPLAEGVHDLEIRFSEAG